MQINKRWSISRFGNESVKIDKIQLMEIYFRTFSVSLDSRVVLLQKMQQIMFHWIADEPQKIKKNNSYRDGAHIMQTNEQKTMWMDEVEVLKNAFERHTTSITISNSSVPDVVAHKNHE